MLKPGTAFALYQYGATVYFFDRITKTGRGETVSAYRYDDADDVNKFVLDEREDGIDGRYFRGVYLLGFSL